MARLLVSYVQQGCTKMKPNKQAARLVLMDNFKMRMGRDPANNACLVSMNLTLDPMSAMLALLASIMMKQVKWRQVLVQSAQLDVKRRLSVLLNATSVPEVNTRVVQDKRPVKRVRKGNTNNLWSKHSVIRANLANGKIKLANWYAKLV